MENDEIEFTVKCKMKKRWVPTFMDMLHKMVYDGHIGHSEFVGLYSDGDGDFRPEFESDIEFNKGNSYELSRRVINPKCPDDSGHAGTFYDAG